MEPNNFGNYEVRSLQFGEFISNISTQPLFLLPQDPSCEPTYEFVSTLLPRVIVLLDTSQLRTTNLTEIAEACNRLITRKQPDGDIELAVCARNEEHNLVDECAARLRASQRTVSHIYQAEKIVDKLGKKTEARYVTSFVKAADTDTILVEKIKSLSLGLHASIDPDAISALSKWRDTQNRFQNMDIKHFEFLKKLQPELLDKWQRKTLQEILNDCIVNGLWTFRSSKNSCRIVIDYIFPFLTKLDPELCKRLLFAKASALMKGFAEPEVYPPNIAEFLGVYKSLDSEGFQKLKPKKILKRYFQPIAFSLSHKPELVATLDTTSFSSKKVGKYLQNKVFYNGKSYRFFRDLCETSSAKNGPFHDLCKAWIAEKFDPINSIDSTYRLLNAKNADIVEATHTRVQEVSNQPQNCNLDMLQYAIRDVIESNGFQVNRRCATQNGDIEFFMFRINEPIKYGKWSRTEMISGLFDFAASAICHKVQDQQKPLNDRLSYAIKILDTCTFGIDDRLYKKLQEMLPAEHILAQYIREVLIASDRNGEAAEIITAKERLMNVRSLYSILTLPTLVQRSEEIDSPDP